MFGLRAAVFYLLLGALAAYGHPGGVNRFSCHNDNIHGGTHCHNDSSTNTSSSAVERRNSYSQRSWIPTTNADDVLRKRRASLPNQKSRYQYSFSAANADQVEQHYSEKELRLEINALLIQLGYLEGTPDTISNNLSMVAIKRYQQDRGITIDGTVSLGKRPFQAVIV